MTITVTPRNLPPVSAGDAYAVDEDGVLSVAAPGVLGNDADPEGQPLTAQLVSGPAHGTLTLNAGRRLHLHARPRTTTAPTGSGTARPTA